VLAKVLPAVLFLVLVIGGLTLAEVVSQPGNDQTGLTGTTASGTGDAGAAPSTGAPGDSGDVASGPDDPPAPPISADPAPTPRPAITPQLGENYTDFDVFSTGLFFEPLVPVGGEASVEEREAFREAINAYAVGREQKVLEAFVAAWPESRWRAALEENFGLSAYSGGYFTKALAHWQEAWDLAKGAQDDKGHALADQAVTNLLRLNSGLGRMEVMEPLLGTIKGRDMRGSAYARLQAAQEALMEMKNNPDHCFQCGPYALAVVRKAMHYPEKTTPQAIQDAKSGPEGFSLARVSELATELEMPNTMVKADAVTDIPVPAVVHWRLGHYAAIVDRRADTYLVKDWTFGFENWVSGDAIRQEASGYFLVFGTPAAGEFRVVDAEEGGKVFGRGKTRTRKPNQTSNADPKCPDGKCPHGMPWSSVHAMNVSLHVEDTPVSYTPPYGPEIDLELHNNELEDFQPGNQATSNFGRQWSFNWTAYIDSGTSGPATVALRNGGLETFSEISGTLTDPDPKSHARLKTYFDGTPMRIERLLPDGSKEVYQPLVTSGTRYWLSQVVDPQGNAATLVYDGTTARITKITDALNQDTVFSYDGTDAFQVTKVTPPISGTYTPKSASFTYDATMRLSTITDAVVNTSTIAYSGSSDVVSALITPYGTTSYARGLTTVVDVDTGSNVVSQQWIETTDPLGGKERVEMLRESGQLADTIEGDPGTIRADLNPFGGTAYGEPVFEWGWFIRGKSVGFNVSNSYLNYRNTFFWGKKQMAEMTNSGTVTIDYKKAAVYHWCHLDLATTSPLLESYKPPLDNRIWFMYPGADAAWDAPNYAPSEIGIVVGGTTIVGSGSTELWQYDRDSIGRIKKATDPLGRETNYNYYSGTATPDPSVVYDLTSVTQGIITTGTDPTTHLPYVVSSTTETLLTATWNSAHRPLAITDAANKTTNYTWNSKGQILKIVNAVSGTTTFTYSATGTGETYGYLMTVDPALSGTNDAITYTYDTLGRVKTRTQWGYTEQYTYDKLDRLTKVTYPDSTYEQLTYDKLDVHAWRNRLGITGTLTWDANRHLTADINQSGKSILYEWCNCGSMTKLTDRQGNETDWQYDLQSRPIEKDFADGTKQYTAYNVVGLVASSTDAKGQVKTYSYALDNRMTGVSYSGTVTPSVSYVWDDDYPRITHVDSGTTSYGFTYRATGTTGAGQISTVNGNLTDDTVTYRYDSLGRRFYRQVNTSVNQNVWTYDAIGRVTSATTPLGTFSYTYDGTNGRLARVDYPNGQHTEYTYYGPTGDLNLQQIMHLSGTTPIWQESYTYDAAQNNIVSRVTQTGTNAAKTYTYSYYNTSDLLDEADCAQDTANYPQDHSYTDAYNLAKVVTPSGTKSFTYNNVNERLTQTGYSGTSQTYDANGNLATSKVFSGTVSWDAEDRPIAIDFPGGKRVEYVYDGLGRRVAIRDKTSGVLQAEHQYIYDGNQIVEHRLAATGTTPQTIYCAQGEQKLLSGTPINYAYVRDYLGSVRMSVSDAGSVIESQDYPPYGYWPDYTLGANPSASADVGYAGYFKDPVTSLWLTKYRVLGYGQWFSRDPLEDAELRQGPNPYTYVGNNPVNWMDPRGLQQEELREEDVEEEAREIRNAFNLPEAPEPLDIPTNPERIDDIFRQEQLENEAKLRYPKKADREEDHHICPIYLGGDPNGPLARLNAAYHQLITNAFRNEVPYGEGPVNPTYRQTLMDKVYSQYPLP